MTDRARDPRRRGLVAEISHEGLVAGLTVCAVLVLSGAAFVVGGWDELWSRCGRGAAGCRTSAAAAGLVTIFSLAAIVAGAGLAWRLRRRPVDPAGSSRAVVALGVAFAVGMLLLSWRIPAFTCARGRLDTFLDLCMHPPTTSDPASWLWVKLTVALLGVAGGIAIALLPRWVRGAAAITALACGAGVGLFLAQTLAG